MMSIYLSSGPNLFGKLKLVQPMVEAMLRQEFLVGTILNQFAFMQHQNTINMPNRAEAVGDHN
jgi:hypothetical protein